MEKQHSDGRSSQPSDEELPFLGRWGPTEIVLIIRWAPVQDPDMGRSPTRAMAILNSFVNDITERIDRPTLYSATEIQTLKDEIETLKTQKADAEKLAAEREEQANTIQARSNLHLPPPAPAPISMDDDSPPHTYDYSGGIPSNMPAAFKISSFSAKEGPETSSLGSRSLRPSPTSTTPRPPSRVMDDDYDDGHGGGLELVVHCEGSHVF
ncbi:hypothetical protein EDD22DRAFT_956110 [Suillus occidentalis]|nr:hypothetical protein EDD22DRAFT_956110 [Suillus occidentalis]